MERVVERAVRAPRTVGHALPRAARLWQAARTRAFEAWVFLYSLGYGIAIVLLLHHIRTPRLVRRVLRSWTTIFIHSARAMVGVGWRIEGAERIPEGPVLFVANHQSYWESIAFTVFLKDVNIVSKEGAMRIPVFGWGLRHAPMIPVDRRRPGQNLRRLLREGVRSLREGRSVLIFPEGTRVPVDGRRPFARGVERLYAAAGVPVVPIVTDAGTLWPAGFSVKRPGTITIRFLPPVPPGMGAEAFHAEIQRIVNTEKDRLSGVDSAPR